MDAVIGIDIGTQSTKALLAGPGGAVLAQASHGYAPDTPRPNWAEQWPQVWLDAVERCLAEVARTPGVTVRAICVSSLYGGSGIPVDVAMEPLHPCLIWMDRRAEAQADWVKHNVDLRWLGEVTGNGVDSYYGYTKIMWLRDERPEVWARTALLLPPNAWIIQRLTGEVAVDHSSAGNIGGVYDITARTWSRPAMEALGISARLMPERLVDPAAIVGGLLPEVASRLGLPAGTPVVAGGVDAAMATYAAGVTAPGHHVAMLGTSMCWGFIAPGADAAHGLVAMPYVAGHDLYVFGGAATAGASVTWFREEFCQAEADEARRTGRDPHAILEEGAAKVPPGADGLVFLPYLMGERSPVWDARASGAFAGLNLFHTRAHLYRAVLEGVALSLRHNMEAGARLAASGRAPALEPRLAVVGGAARSDLWMRIIADITGYPVWTIEGDVEAALGAARLAALAAGLDEGGTWVTLKQRAAPDGGTKARYDALFAVYTGLYPAMKDSMHALAALRGPSAA